MTRSDQHTYGRVFGKVSLVTGAASGIGQATALLLAQEGATVIVTDIDANGAQQVTQKILSKGRHSSTYQLDVTSPQAWESVIHTVLNSFGRLDVLVNNAGIAAAYPITDMTLEEWRRIMAVNADGAFLGTKHGVRAMRRSSGNGGSIINVASVTGIKAAPGASAYAASKAAVRLLSKSVALECAQKGDGIRVNTVLSGGVITPVWHKADWWSDFVSQHGNEQTAMQALAKDTPLQRFGDPQEIAQAILYLASDESQFVTGSELVIDGGWSA